MDIARFKCSAEIVVVHDTEEPAYHYDEAVSLYKHRLKFKLFVAHTTVLSNYFPLQIFLDFIGKDVVYVE